MSIRSFVEGLEKITNPQNFYYHPIQITLFGGVTYLSTICLTSLSPLCTVSFVVIAYGINHFIVPYFCRFLKGYKSPLIGQALHLGCSALGSKMICHLFCASLSLSQIIQIGCAFLLTLYLCQWAFLRLRQQLSQTTKAISPLTNISSAD